MTKLIKEDADFMCWTMEQGNQDVWDALIGYSVVPEIFRQDKKIEIMNDEIEKLRNILTSFSPSFGKQVKNGVV